MQGLKSLFRRPQTPAPARPQAGRGPVELSPQDLKHVAGGLPRVGPSSAPGDIGPLPRVG